MIKITERLKKQTKEINWVKLGIKMLLGLIGIAIFIYMLREGLLTFTLGT